LVRGKRTWGGPSEEKGEGKSRQVKRVDLKTKKVPFSGKRGLVIPPGNVTVPKGSEKTKRNFGH